MKITIGVGSFNCLKHTVVTIESLLNYCQEDYDLITVDNGSTDETPMYFESLQNDPRAIKHNYCNIRYSKNLGCSKFWNTVCGWSKNPEDISVVVSNDVV